MFNKLKKSKKEDSIKIKKSKKNERFRLWLKNTKFFLPFEFFKWKFIDIYRFFKYGSKLHLYGIWCFVGIYGGGKTISLVEYLESIRAKYGNDVYIATNFFYLNQDFPITHWKDLLPERDKPIIFAYDELQNEFGSRDYKSFPVSLMTLLTQNRKGNGKQIVYTTQDYETVDKSFRRLTKNVVTCRTILGRLVRCRHYDREDFEHLQSAINVSTRIKIRPFFTKTFVQTDYIRNLYDSFKMLDSAKSKDYMDRQIDTNS